MRLPAAAVRGRVEFAARRAHVWGDPAERRPDGSVTPPVRRMILEGDVVVTLGLHRFNARRAVVWMRRLEPNEADDAPTGSTVHQVFVYFDQVGGGAADAAVTVSADRLSVQGVVATEEPVRLHVDLAQEGRPADPFIDEAETELADHLHAIVFPPAPPARVERRWRQDRPLVERPPVRDEPARVVPPPPRVPPPPPPPPPPTVEALRDQQPRDTPPQTETAPPTDEDTGTTQTPAGGRVVEPAPPPARIFPSDGVFTFSAGQIVLVPGDDERAILLTGGVRIQYWQPRSQRSMQLTAERAVIFLSPGSAADLTRLSADDVLGLYLEGDATASDGKYTLRGPRIYYDLQQDRGLIADAVLWSYDARRQIPLYVRAAAIRQEGDRQFVAERATLANTRFARPHFSIGAGSVSVTRYGRKDGTSGNLVDARDLTLRGGGIPFLYWPRFVGDPNAIPLRSAAFESSSRTGPAWKSTWDAWSLLGLRPPDGLRTDLLFDYYNERGFAIGTEAAWNRADSRSNLFAYMLFDDSGTDVTKPGPRLERDGGTRGIVLADHQWRVNDLWTLTLEGSYISDPRLAAALFQGISETRREITTRGHLARRDDHTLLQLEAKTDLTDFITNDYLLSSQGYSVDKLPEAVYSIVGLDLSPDAFPGLFTYHGEHRLGQLALNFHDPEARETGYRTRRLSEAAFGIDPVDSIADRLRAEGLHESPIVRADTRNEFSMQLAAGPINVNPFVVARGTAWDTDFSGFAPEESDNARLWGGAGVRISTTIHRLDDLTDSRVFDLHRVRHVVEPGVTIWHGFTNLDRVNLPVYDDSVESIAEGTMIRAGIDQTWQTKRGGPGRWRTVDVLTLRTEYVWSSDDTDPESPIGRWFEDRPELSNPGEFVNAEALWQATDAVGIVGRIVYDFDINQPAYSSTGIVIDHTPDFRTFASTNYVNAMDSTIVTFGATYTLTSKYKAGFSGNYDTNAGDFERFSATLTRDFPNVTLGVAVTYNKITDETGVGVILSPRGLSGAVGVGGLGASRGNTSRLGG
ncbi:MAG: hypothetical protein KIS87_00430 [Phycisphaeraceae bacterium]|nr:hypothetical protein [Phycisphaeraceae bacterium]